MSSEIFVNSQRIENIIVMAKQFHCLPSEVLFIEDEYTAYCFNEACSIILIHLMNEEEPVYKNEGLDKEDKRHFKTMSDYYKSLGM